MDRKPAAQYQIRWSSGKLDWERHASRADAEASAESFVRFGETFIIEKAAELKYPWQVLVAEALTEQRPEHLPGKINAAERSIAARLCEPTDADTEECWALREALASLRAIFPQRRILALDKTA